MWLLKLFQKGQGLKGYTKLLSGTLVED